MRYHESKERSAELLRLALPLMAQQRAGYHPQSYTIWYEHTAGINPRLSQAIEQRGVQSPALSEEDVWRLYASFVVARDVESMERMQQQLSSLLDDTAMIATSAGEGASQFTQTLEIHKSQLLEPLAPDHLPNIVGELLANTERMRSTTQELVRQLDHYSSEVKRLTEQLEQAEHQARLDPLTGILNRRGFAQSLEVLKLEGGSLRGGVLLVIDIDHFKTINDSYGHVLGDKVIRTVAQVISGNIKGRDIAGRLGGEEFAVFLTQTSVDGATILAEHIRSAMEARTIRRSGRDEPMGRVTLSIGLATATADADSFDALLARADGAMYEAKRAGRNRVVVHDALQKNGMPDQQEAG